MYQKIIIPFLIITLLLGMGFFYYIKKSENFIKNTHVTVDVKIDKNEKFIDTYNKIFKYLDTPPFFKYYVKYILLFSVNRKYGFYTADNLSIEDLLLNISTGKQKYFKILVVDGYNIYDIGSLLDKEGIISYEDFIKTCLDKTFITKLTGHNLLSLEGFLYPDTYNFHREASAENVIRVMYKNFLKHLPGDFIKTISNYGLDYYEGIILASIVQKETFEDEEYKIIASVFYNRLKKHMRLQADPTVIYGIYSSFNGNLRKEDLENKANKYNTYKIKGLPPTPICNFSFKVLEGLMNPAKTNYLYFVANGKGGHIFSSTYKEHRNNIKKYLNMSR